MKYTIMPSIIAHSQKELESRLKKIRKIKSNKPSLIQLDIMDGEFVPQTSLEFDFKLPKGVKAEAHLMLNSPMPWLIHNHRKVSCVIAHYKSDTHMHELIKLAKKYKLKVGIAINPEVPSEAISQYLKLVDKILIMAVNPGKYGSSFIPSMLNKIKHLRELNKAIDIEVDGGITPETLKQCKQVGANQFVVGSYLQNSKNINNSWKDLNRAFK